MPDSRALNQHEIRDKLVSAATLHHSVDRITDWWNRAYAIAKNPDINDRFISEAKATLAHTAVAQFRSVRQLHLSRHISYVILFSLP
jgi:hypothetical protein